MTRLAGPALIVALLLAAEGTAAAHDGDTASTPADGEVVDCGALDRAEIVFAEAAVEPIVEIAGPDGARLVIDVDAISDASIDLHFDALTAPGTHEIRWFAQGRDNHPINGSAAFEVTDNCDTTSPRSGLALVVATGSLALVALVLRRAIISRRTNPE